MTTSLTSYTCSSTKEALASAKHGQVGDRYCVDGTEIVYVVEFRGEIIRYDNGNMLARRVGWAT